jgi:hypothetical protein
MVRLLGRGDSLRTTADGEFLFRAVSAEDHRVEVRAVGYIPRRMAVRVKEKEGWSGVIVMDRVPQELPELTVKAAPKPPEFEHTSKYDDYFRRQRLGFGTFRSADDFRKAGTLDMTGALKGIPGVMVSTTGNVYGEPELRMRMARCPGEPPNISIYLNGNRIAKFGEKGSELSGFGRARPQASTCSACVALQEMVASVPFTDVQFIEFYRGPGQIPAEFDLGDSCAVLAIWTK